MQKLLSLLTVLLLIALIISFPAVTAHAHSFNFFLEDNFDPGDPNPSKWETQTNNGATIKNEYYDPSGLSTLRLRCPGDSDSELADLTGKRIGIHGIKAQVRINFGSATNPNSDFIKLRITNGADYIEIKWVKYQNGSSGIGSISQSGYGAPDFTDSRSWVFGQEYREVKIWSAIDQNKIFLQGSGDTWARWDNKVIKPGSRLEIEVRSNRETNRSVELRMDSIDYYLPNYPALGIIGYWPLQERSSDASGNGGDGTTSNTNSTTGKLGKALSFNGASSFVEASKLPDSSSVTLSCWMKPASLPTDTPRYLIFEGDETYRKDLFVRVSPGGAVEFQTRVGALNRTPDGVIDTESYHHIVCTSSEDKSTIYVDGQKLSEVEGYYDNAGFHHNLQIGRMADGGSDDGYFHGIIDEVVVFNRAIPASEADLLGKDDNNNGLADFFEQSDGTPPTVTPSENEMFTETWESAALAKYYDKPDGTIVQADNRWTIYEDWTDEDDFVAITGGKRCEIYVSDPPNTGHTYNQWLESPEINDATLERGVKFTGYWFAEGSTFYEQENYGQIRVIFATGDIIYSHEWNPFADYTLKSDKDFDRDLWNDYECKYGRGTADGKKIVRIILYCMAKPKNNQRIIVDNLKIFREKVTDPKPRSPDIIFAEKWDAGVERLMWDPPTGKIIVGENTWTIKEGDDSGQFSDEDDYVTIMPYSNDKSNLFLAMEITTPQETPHTYQRSLTYSGFQNVQLVKDVWFEGYWKTSGYWGETNSRGGITINFTSGSLVYSHPWSASAGFADASIGSEGAFKRNVTEDYEAKYGAGSTAGVNIQSIVIACRAKPDSKQGILIDNLIIYREFPDIYPRATEATYLYDHFDTGALDTGKWDKEQSPNNPPTTAINFHGSEIMLHCNGETDGEYVKIRQTQGGKKGFKMRVRYHKLPSSYGRFDIKYRESDSRFLTISVVIESGKEIGIGGQGYSINILKTTNVEQGRDYIFEIYEANGNIYIDIDGEHHAVAESQTLATNSFLEITNQSNAGPDRDSDLAIDYVYEYPDPRPYAALEINNGATETKYPIVNLKITTNAQSRTGRNSKMRFSNDGEKWSAPEPLLADKVWSIPDTKGKHKVYLQVSDGNNYWSPSITDEIELKSEAANTFVAREWSGRAGVGVNTSSGNFHYSRTDLEVPARGIDFTFARYYNSQDKQPAPSPMGRGWNHSYGMHLAPLSDGSVSVIYPDGHREFYRYRGAGVFTSDSPGAYSKLERRHETNQYYLTTRDKIKYAFDAEYRLLSISDENDNKLELQYADGKLVTIKDPVDRTYTLAYDANGYIQSLTDPIGRTIQYEHDANGHLTSVANARGYSTTFTYDASDRMTTIVNPRGFAELTIGYDDKDRVISQKDVLANETTFAYNDNEKITTVTDALGNKTKQKHNDNDALTESTDENNGKTRYEYDEKNNRVRYTDANGNSFEFTFDEQGNAVQKTDPLGNTIKAIYEPVHNAPISVTDAEGNTRTFDYDPKGNLTKAVDALNYTVSFQYNSFGQPTEITDARGNKIIREYDPKGYLKSVTAPSCCANEFTYDDVGRVLTAEDANDHAIQFTYDENNNVLTRTDPRGFVWTYEYDESDNLISITDPKDNVTTYSYTERDKVNEVEDPLGRKVKFEYDALGRVKKVTDRRGNSIERTYDPKGNLRTVTDPLGNVTQYFYDKNDNVIQVVKPDGSFTTYDNNKDNLLMEMKSSLGQTVKFTYNKNDRLKTMTNPRGGETVYEYDANGRLVVSVAPLGQRTEMVYDGNGNMIRLLDANSHVTSFEYDDKNRLISKTDAIGRITDFEYDKKKNIASIKDPMGNLYQFTYDESDNILTITDPLGQTKTFEYDQLNNRIAVTNPRGYTTRYTYTPFNKVETVEDALGRITTYGYDENDNLIAITSPLGKVTNFEYDERDLKTATIDPLGNTLATRYDELGRVSMKIDQVGETTGYKYDKMSRLIQVIDAVNGKTTAAYDEMGNLLNLTDSLGNTRQRTYDDLNRLIAEIDSLGNRTEYQYDLANNLLSKKTPNGDVIQYEYDAANQLTSVGLPGSDHIEFTYNSNGSITGMDDSLGHTDYAYDAINRMTQYRSPFGDTVGYAYNPNGDLDTLIYPDGKQVTYAYNPVDRLQSVTDWLARATTYDYNDADKLTRMDHPNGTYTTYAFDIAERLVGVAHYAPDDSALSSITQTLDPRGNPISMISSGVPTDPVIASVVRQYGYAPNSNRLASVNDIEFAYDANGNRIQRTDGSDVTSYDYDALDRLIGISGPGAEISNEYDGANRRIRQTRNGVERRMIYTFHNGRTDLLAERDSNGNITAYYVWGRAPLSRVAPNNAQSVYHFDPYQNTQFLTDDSGSVSDSYIYDPFGTIVDRVGNTPNPFTYAGFMGVIDDGNDLYDMRDRFYDPTVGRFLSKDPERPRVRTPQQINEYVYALNNPYSFQDSDGRAARRKYAVVGIHRAFEAEVRRRGGIVSGYRLTQGHIRNIANHLKAIRERYGDNQYFAAKDRWVTDFMAEHRGANGEFRGQVDTGVFRGDPILGGKQGSEPTDRARRAATNRIRWSTRKEAIEKGIQLLESIPEQLVSKKQLSTQGRQQLRQLREQFIALKEEETKYGGDLANNLARLKILGNKLSGLAIELPNDKLMRVSGHFRGGKYYRRVPGGAKIGPYFRAGGIVISGGIKVYEDWGREDLSVATKICRGSASMLLSVNPYIGLSSSAIEFASPEGYDNGLTWFCSDENIVIDKGTDLALKGLEKVGLMDEFQDWSAEPHPWLDFLTEY